MSKVWRNKWIHTALAGVMVLSVVPTAKAATNTSVESNVVTTSESSQSDSDSVLQETKISREEAIEIAKKHFDIPEGYQGPEVSRDSFRYENQVIWQVRWRKEGPDYAFIEVGVDADTGQIVRYYANQNNDENNVTFPPEVSYEEAVDIAKKFVTRIYGEKAAQYQVDDRYTSWGRVIQSPHDQYSVRFIMLKNGVPFPRNSINVQVNGNGKVVSFYANLLEDVTFEEKQDILTVDELREMLQQDLEMNLVYRPSFTDYRERQKREPEMVLSYEPENWRMWDAHTGKPLNYNGDIVEEQEQQELNPLASEPVADPPQQREKPLTDEEALQVLHDRFELPDEITIGSVQKRPNTPVDSSDFWHIMFRYEYNRGSVGWTGAVIDASTGEIVRFDISPYLGEKLQQEQKEQDDEYPVAYEEAKEEALQFVKSYSKDKLHQLFLVETRTDPDQYRFLPSYRFVFQRYIDGVQVHGHFVAVTVSADSGDVVSFDQNWDWDKEFPPVEEVITEEEARQIFLDSYDLRLEYHVSSEEVRAFEENKENMTAWLIYRPQQKSTEPFYIDAVSGEKLSSRDGKPLSEEGDTGLQDIQGHWAEKELNYLVQLEAIELQDGKVNPDKQVSRGEMMDIFARVVDRGYRYYAERSDQAPAFEDVGKDHKYYNAVQWAVMRDFIDGGGAFHPDRAITREELAVWVVKALGLASLAEKEEFFQVSFQDRHQLKHPGYVALVNALGIMNGKSDGNFYPGAPVTRAEAAVVLVRFMNQRNQLDSPIQ
ncbi:MAG: S-layer homology domain-containing protein [Bacillaceae bacterium]|nr:S-layer homology domain-containing protein [Bacillaceae bacterium]